MSLSLVIALAVASLIVSLAVMVGSIWLAGRVWQVPDVSWRRAALATLWLTLGSWGLLAAMYFAMLKLGGAENNLPLAAVGLAALLGYLALIVVCVGRPLRTGKLKALCVGLSAYAAQSAVAVTLAMGCRDRLLEGFTVPTGAMAPTIYGDHFSVTCPNCGHAFAVRAPEREFRVDPPHEGIVTCLNCGNEFPAPTSAKIVSGDRILVDKRATPRRWDCVTFRERCPEQLIYVKRVIGLPGENVELAGGDVFVDGRRIRKHARQQTDLWMPRHDTKSVSHNFDDNTPRWHPAAEQSRWASAGEGGWAFNGITAEFDSLEFHGEITDACPYNVQYGYVSVRRYVEIGDVRVTCHVTAFSGPGSLQLTWQFGGKELRLSAGSSSAEIATADKQLASRKFDKFLRAGEILEFAVRDGTAYVLCGAEEVAADFLPDSLESANADSAGAKSSCRLSLVAEQCRLEISRVRIDRDIYYLNREDFERRIGYMGDEGKEFSSQLGADEYFMLGDNVLASKDSRFIGPIPTGNVIGVARWRYWPQSRWHALD